jgi:toxin ParE1/3/4
VSYQVVFSPEARDQLDAIEDYIASAASARIAARYVDGIVAYCESFVTIPPRGTKRNDLVPGLRITNYRRRVVIAFIVDESAETVGIVGVFYGGQDHEARLRTR